MHGQQDLGKQLEAAREAQWEATRVKKLIRWPGRKRATLRELINRAVGCIDWICSSAAWKG
jgi:hypothetical protein